MSTPYTSLSPPAIEISGLRKSYGTHQVLDDISLAVPKGSIFALLGPNGAGKTTLINILCTLTKPDAGKVVVAGHDVIHAPRPVRHAISLTGQFTAVDQLLTGRENLRMMARLLHLPRRAIDARVTELVRQFELADAADRLARTYSGGMRRRLDIALSLLSRPEVLFLDEPTTGLDPRSRQGVWQLVRELRDDGVTVVLTTQYLEEADSLADSIAVLDDGRLVAEGSATSLKRRVGADIVEISYADGGREALPTDGSVADVRRILAAVDGKGRSVEKLALRQPSLDDVFLQLTGTPEAPKNPEGSRS